MSGLRYTEVSQRELKFLDMTSLTVEEFGLLVPGFEEAFQERMNEWRLDGKRRSGRGYTTYANCPLPTPEDRLLFILVYMKTNSLQVVQGEVFGMPQNKANQWIHTFLPVLQTTLRRLGDAPARSMEQLAQRLGLNCGLSEPVEAETASQDTPPLFATMEPNDASSAPKMPINKKATRAARKKATRTVKNVVLVDKQLTIQFLSPTHPGTVHDTRLADTTPYPLPSGSHLLQDLGFLAFTLEGVTIEMPTKKPRGGALTPEQKEANRTLAHRRVSIEHVNSRIKRCRILKDVCRLLRTGVRDLVEPH
jgi:hypothetical protein